jgi:hypothetical protein
MKHNNPIKLFIIISAILVMVITSKAQTATNVPSFFTSVEAYMTSFNTNYTFTNNIFDLETGYKQVTGANASSFATFDYYITQNFEASAEIQYSGVGSAINGGELGIGYAIVNHFDTRLTLDLYGGYDDIRASAMVEPKVEIKKKLSTNTFASIGISLPIFFSGGFNTDPTFWAGAGFTY